MMRFDKLSLLSLLFALAALSQGGSAAYVAAKASLAQLLLEQAWQQSDSGREIVKPWPWADTWPAARLRLPRQHYDSIVLAGASGRNLAFGPAHVDGSAWPGDEAATLIAGHRDTHFAVLETVAVGDPLRIERRGQRYDYRVIATRIVHHDRADAISRELGDGEGVALVTCYPFHALAPGTPWRYVVLAKPVVAR
jgi:sortase A